MTDQPRSLIRRNAVRPSFALCLAAIAFVMAILAMAAENIATERSAAYDDARRTSENLARTLAAHVRQAVAAADQFLIGVTVALRNSTREGLRLQADEIDYLILRTQTQPVVNGFLVLDAVGQVVHTTDPILASPRDRSDLDIFRALAAPTSPNRLAIGSPILEPSSGTVFLPIGRKLLASDGRFAGAIVALIDSAHLVNLFRTIDTGASGAISLVHGSGGLIARWPYFVQQDGGASRNLRVMDELAVGMSGNSRLSVTPLDGVTRMIAWRRVDDTPMAVLVGLAETDFLAAWRADTELTAAKTGLSIAIVVVLAALLYRQLLRNERAHQELRMSEARFRDFTDASADWFWEQDENLRFTFMSASNEKISGLKVHERHGKTRRETNPLGVSEEQWAQHEADLRARRPFRDFRIQRVDGQGKLRHLSINGVPVFDATGAFRGYRGTGCDITAQVEAEQLTQAVIDAIPCLINAKDPHGRYVLMNSYQAQLYGTTPDDAIGKTAGELLDEAYGSQTGTMDAKVVATGQPTGFYQERIPTADGVTREWLTAKLPIKDAHGQVRLVISASIDITERVRAEQRLMQTQQMLRAVIDGIPGIINAKDISGRYILMNDFQARLFGHTPESVMGRTATDLFESAHAANTATLERRLIETGQATGFYQDHFAGVDGVKRDWLTNKLPVMDAHGQVQFVLSTSVEITERVQAERQLVEAKQLLRTVIDAIPGMINAKDPRGRYVLMSSYQARLYGTTPEEAVGKTAAELLGAEYGAYTSAIEAEVIATRQPTGFYEEQYCTADGVTRDWLTAKLPLLDGDGAARLIITVALDISERKAAERSLLQAQERLQHAMQVAVSANRAKSDFLANMSHELRTPLNAIMGFAEIMKLGLFGPLGSKRYSEYASDIFGSATHLLMLINDILDMAKIEAGKRELTLEPVDCAAEIHEAMRMLQARADNKGVAVSIDTSGGPLVAMLDRRAIRQILLNIVGNAVKFTQQGGSVEVRYETHGDHVAIIVADDGPGIPEDQLAEIGTPFHQAGNSSYTASEGSGLGLAVSRSLVELHGGALQIESTEGVGTTVTVLLPNRPCPAEEALPHKTAA